MPLPSSWLQAVGHILYDALIAALGAAGGGLITLPSLGSEALQRDVAQVLMKAGHSMSGYANIAIIYLVKQYLLITLSRHYVDSHRTRHVCMLSQYDRLCCLKL